MEKNSKKNCMVKKKEKLNKNLLWFCAGLVLFLNFGLVQPIIAEGGSLSLSPGSESFAVGDNFLVSLRVDTATASINAAQSTIYFPADKLEVLNISKDNSIFSLWPKEPAFSNLTGEIAFIGGLPHPGFNGKGNIITINFKTKKEGEVNLFFDESKILADDGQGTNILVFIKGAKYFIYQPEVIKKEFEGQIFSSTHPKENEWYNNNSPRFQWNLTQTAKGVSFILDQESETIPDTYSEDLVQNKNYEGIPDGIWYFHLRLADGNSWRETIHYRIQIDAHPPYPFEVIIDNAGDPTNPKPNLYFEAQDEASGINRYEIKIGENKFTDLMLAQINPFSLPILGPGSHKIIVRAVDKANNIVRAKTLLDIEPIESPKINVWPEKYIFGEETFYLEGTSFPENEITIFLKQNDKEIKKWQTLSDSQGQWFFSTKELIKPGIYYLSALAQDKRGAVSNLSDSRKLEVFFSGLGMGNLMITFKNLIWILVLVLFSGIIIAMYFAYRNRQTKKILQKEIKEANDSLFKNFSVLEEKIEKKIALFDLQPGLNEQEKIVYEDIKKSLQNAKESIDKEIKDIERELGQK